MRKYLQFLFIFLAFSCAIYGQNEKKIELSSIKFDGNSVFNSLQLRLVIFSQETPFWFFKFLNSFTSFGKEASYFDSTLIKLDIQALTEYYMTNGYFNCKVTSSYDIDTSAEKARLVYHIREDKPSYFGNFNIVGLISVPSLVYKHIEDNITIDSGKIFSQNLVKENIDRIVQHLRSSGYMNTHYDSTVVYKDTVNLRANLNVYFTPGDYFSVREIVLKKDGAGASSVEDTLIKQIVNIKPGENYNLDKIKRGQDRLYRTGMFSSITVTPNGKDTSNHSLPIEIKGTIGQMNELSPEVIMGYEQNALNIGLATAYSRKNFLGDARKFTASGSFGIQDLLNINLKKLASNFSIYDTKYLGYADARLTLEQPFLFGEPIVGIFETYGTIYKNKSYNVTKYGGKTTFDIEMPQYTFVNSLSPYYNLEVNNEFRIISNVNVKRTVTLSAIGADLKSSKADNPVFPTQGNNSSFVIEEANSLLYLLSKLNRTDYTGTLYFKLLGTTAYYFPVPQIKNSAWGVKFKLGYMQAYKGDEQNIPSDRKFFVGGANSLRGWDAMDSKLNVIKSADLAQDTGSGGTFLFEGSGEFRMKFLTDFGLAFFMDYGRSWVDLTKFRIDDIAVDAGVGFRYYTSIVPFRVDFAVRLYDPTLPTGRDRWILYRQFFKIRVNFNLGIGEAF